MKILVAVDGSDYTSNALVFLVTNENLAGAQDELFVLNVQPAFPPGVTRLVGADLVADSHRIEADKVLDPVRLILDRHPVRYRCEWVVGVPAAAILEAIRRENAQLVVMGTHGQGMLSRVLMGSVAQRVVADCDVPVLLVK